MGVDDTMRKLNYHYSMQLSFSEPVNRHHFTLRCFPKENDRQRIDKQHVNIEPSYSGGMETDSFGNKCIYGLIEKAHMRFTVDVSGLAYVYDGIYQSVEEPHRIGMFRYHTKLTEPGPAIQCIYERCGDKGFYEKNVGSLIGISDFIKNSNDIVDRAYHMMNIVFHSLSYEPGLTGVRTTAEEAVECGKGVCQDYAHILLTLLRMEHIPCRYVVGMMSGEGASHAWVEVCDGEKWVSIDPTNNCMVDDHYISISHGRDANDCTINQGYFYGSTEQTQEIHVLVEEVIND